MQYEYKGHQFELALRSTDYLVEIYKITISGSKAFLPLNIKQIRQDEENELVAAAIQEVEAAAERLIQNNKGLGIKCQK